MCMLVFKNRPLELSGLSPEGFGAQCIHPAHQLAGPHVPFQPEFIEPEAHTCSGCITDKLPLIKNGCASSGRSTKHPTKAKNSSDKSGSCTVTVRVPVLRGVKWEK